MRLHHPLQFLAAAHCVDVWHKVELLRNKTRMMRSVWIEGLPGDRGGTCVSLHLSVDTGSGSTILAIRNLLVQELCDFGQVTKSLSTSVSPPEIALVLFVCLLFLKSSTGSSTLLQLLNK